MKRLSDEGDAVVRFSSGLEETMVRLERKGYLARMLENREVVSVVRVLFVIVSAEELLGMRREREAVAERRRKSQRLETRDTDGDEELGTRFNISSISSSHNTTSMALLFAPRGLRIRMGKRCGY